MKLREEGRGLALIAGATLFWALSGVLAKLAFSHRPIAPLVMVELRLLCSLAILAAIMAIRYPDELQVRRDGSGPAVILLCR